MSIDDRRGSQLLSNALALGFVGGALAGGLLVFVLRDRSGAMSAGATPSSSATADRPTGDGTASDELVAEMRRIRELLEARSERERAPATSLDAAALERMLDQRIAALALNAGAVDAGVGARSSLATLARSAPGARSDLWSQPLSGEESNEFFQKHRFWTYEDVLQAYGSPDRIRLAADGTLVWHYFDEARHRRANFEFFQGMVIESTSSTD